MTTLYAKRNLCYHGSIIRQGAHLPPGVRAEMLDRWAEEDAIAPVPVVELPDLTPAHVEERVYGPAPPRPELDVPPPPLGAVAGEAEIVAPPGFNFPAEPVIVAPPGAPVGGPTLDEHGRPVETTPAGDAPATEDGPKPDAVPAGDPTAGQAEPPLNMADGLSDQSDADAPTTTTPPGGAGQPASPTPPAAETIRTAQPRRGNRR